MKLTIYYDQWLYRVILLCYIYYCVYLHYTYLPTILGGMIIQSSIQSREEI